MTDKPLPPVFRQAMNEALELADRLGQDHPRAAQAMQQAMLHAPDWLVNEMGDIAREMGLMPEPDYLEDGTPVYNSRAIAQKLGVSEDEVNAAIEALNDDRQAMGLPTLEIDPKQVHRRQ